MNANPEDAPDRGEPEAPSARPRMKLSRQMKRLAVIIPATYVGVCMFAYAFQSRLIYFPSRDVWATPHR